MEPVLAMSAVKEFAAKLPLMGAFLTSKPHVLCLLWALVMLPLSLAENLSAFEASSTFGVISLLYLVLSVAGHSVYECRLEPENTYEKV